MLVRIPYMNYLFWKYEERIVTLFKIFREMALLTQYNVTPFRFLECEYPIKYTGV